MEWPRPIPVTERLPELHQSVFLWCEFDMANGSTKGYWTGAAIIMNYEREIMWVIDLEPDCDYRKTHWIPAPPPPLSPQETP